MSHTSLYEICGPVREPQYDLVTGCGELSGELERDVLTTAKLLPSEPVPPVVFQISGADSYADGNCLRCCTVIGMMPSGWPRQSWRVKYSSGVPILA